MLKELTVQKMLPLIYSLLASFIGWGVGGFLIGLLRTAIPHDVCEYSQLGMFAIYDCPWWHPENYYVWLWLLIMIISPFLLNIVRTKIFNMKPFSIWSILSAIIITLMILYVVSEYLVRNIII